MDKQFVLATTRFNTKTWDENVRWRDNNLFKGCIYGSPRRISERIPLEKVVFILEMHNDENVVKGVGLIKNVTTKRCKIYEDQNYNRYTYKGQQRVDRKNMSDEEQKIMKVIDILVFKGERHLKRGQGIIVVPEWIVNNKHFDFIEFFNNMFRIRKG